jgi:spectrin beta
LVPKLPSLPLPQDNFGLELAAVEAAVRKHEAIETDIVAYSGRVQAVDAVAAELAAERYHDIKRIAARQHNVSRLWDFLRQMVAARRERLLLNLELQKVFQDLLYLMDWMAEMKVAGHSWWGSVGQESWECGCGTFTYLLMPVL